MIITMNDQNLVQQLHSCLKETISTSLDRYVKLGVLEAKGHSDQNGGITVYYTCASANKAKIDTMIQQQISFKGLTSEEFATWGDRIEEAVEKALVVSLSANQVAKL